MMNRLLARPVSLARPLSLAVSVVSIAAVLSAGLTAAQAAPSAKTGWRVIKTIGPNNTDLTSIVAFRHGVAPWLAGQALSPKLQFYAAVESLAPMPQPLTALTTQLGTGVNGLSATSPSNVWASLEGVSGGQVDRLSGGSWHPYSFAIGTDDILMGPVVTIGPKSTWALDEDYTTDTAYGYHFNGSKWRRHVLPAAPTANGLVGYVSASSGRNIWALTFVKNKWASMRYNGSKWQVIPFPRKLAPAGTTLGGLQILALSAKNVWATIGTETTTGLGPLVLLHWNGTRWSKVTRKLPDDSLGGAIASDGNGGIWLAAASRATTPVPVILHFSRGRWSTFKVPTFDGKAVGIEDLTLIPGTRSVIGAAIIPGAGESTDGTAVIKYGP
jgi:hypothetical protein